MSRTIQEALAQSAERLRAASSTPRLDAEILLGYVLGWSRSRLLAELTLELAHADDGAFQALVARRMEQEPVAYIIGQREFYGLDLLVDPRVLIPRPETELLIDLALSLAARLANHARPVRIIDVGTGSGAIAIALAIRLPDARIYATDISPDALDVAAVNAARHHVDAQITLLHGDLLTPLPEPVDLIISNPPYTILADIDADVRRFQPHLALDGGRSGLNAYQRLLAQAPSRLRTAGAVLLEIGATQAPSVTALARAAFPSAHIQAHSDLAGWDRAIAIDTGLIA